jgi:phenylpropionate dioxygenase-like ring-hydroxylating dioxygenase large terminal subunit
MRHERQVELLERVANAGPHLEGLHAPASITNPAAHYTDPERFAREMKILFRDGPAFFGLTGELREPGTHRAETVGGVPLVVVRQADGSLRALVNICRHRGAPVVAPGTTGDSARAFTCQYHGWVYGPDGALRGRPGSAGAFDDVTTNCDLLQVAVAERYGLIFVRPGGTEPIDVDAFLSGAQDDLDAFGLDEYVHIESRTHTWRMNWKLVLDTFTESYHIRTLHRDSLLPMFNSDCVIFEPFGRNLVSIGLRKDVRDETAKPRDEWSLLPYGTIQYFLVPTGIVVHQLDHVETWRIEPIDVHTTRLRTSMFAPTEPASERSRQYFVKNLDLLLHVTGTEDFPLMERIQANLDAGSVPELVYGRIEPPLIHYHQAVNAAVDA